MQLCSIIIYTNINKAFLVAPQNTTLRQDIKKHLKNKNKVQGKQEADIAYGKVEVVLLLGGWKVSAHQQYCIESGPECHFFYLQLTVQEGC